MANNLVKVESEVEGAERIIMNIVYDSADPDTSRRYKGLLGRDNSRRPVFSADGIDWSDPGLPAIPSSDESNLYFDDESHLFIATVKQPGPNGRSVYVSISKDFTTWTDPKGCLVFHADDCDQELGRQRILARLEDSHLQTPEYNVPDSYNVDVYNMAVTRYQGIYLGFPSLFHQSGRVPKDWPGFAKRDLTPQQKVDIDWAGDWTGFHNVELVYSRDLLHWNRVPGRRQFLESSPPKKNEDIYDLQTILATSPVVHENEMWFYYTGLKRYSTLESGENNPRIGAVCLAKMRIDGYASFVGGSTPAYVTTKSMVVKGQDLHLNMDALGSIQVEIVDDKTGKPIEGFAFEDCQPLTGDNIDAQVTWAKDSALSLAGRVVRIRFRLVDASLYAFWTQ